jgi:hypothetical protein
LRRPWERVERKQPCPRRPAPAQNSRISRTPSGRHTIIRNGERRADRAPLPSVPESVLFSGRTGHPPRRGHSAGALSPRGILPRKWPGTRPVFGKAPEGAPEKVRTERGLGAQRTLLTPFHQGRKDIIRTGVVIVLSFRPEFPFWQSNGGSTSDGEVGAYAMGATWTLPLPPHVAVAPSCLRSGSGSRGEIDMAGSSVHYRRFSRSIPLSADPPRSRILSLN